MGYKYYPQMALFAAEYTVVAWYTSSSVWDDGHWTAKWHIKHPEKGKTLCGRDIPENKKLATKIVDREELGRDTVCETCKGVVIAASQYSLTAK